MPGANQDNLPDFQRGQTLKASELQTIVEALRQKRLVPGQFQSGAISVQRPTTVNAGYRLIRGTSTAAVSDTDPTFEIDNVVALTQGADLPAEPVRVANVHLKKYAEAAEIYAIYHSGVADHESTPVDWEALPLSGDIHLRFGWVSTAVGPFTAQSRPDLVEPPLPYFDIQPPTVPGTAVLLDFSDGGWMRLDPNTDGVGDEIVGFVSPYFTGGIGTTNDEGSLILLISNVELRDGMVHGVDGVHIWGFYLQVAPQLRDLPGYGTEKHLITDDAGAVMWAADDGSSGGGFPDGTDGGVEYPPAEWADFDGFLDWLFERINERAGGGFMCRVLTSAPAYGGTGVPPNVAIQEYAPDTFALGDSTTGKNGMNEAIFVTPGKYKIGFGVKIGMHKMLYQVGCKEATI